MDRRDGRGRVEKKGFLGKGNFTESGRSHHIRAEVNLALVAHNNGFPTFRGNGRALLSRFRCRDILYGAIYAPEIKVLMTQNGVQFHRNIAIFFCLVKGFCARGYHGQPSLSLPNFLFLRISRERR